MYPMILFVLFFNVWASHLEGVLQPHINPNTCVSYARSAHDCRFGDSLLAFAHGLWFAENHHLPLVYSPFPYAEDLVLYHHPDVLHLDPETFGTIITLNSPGMHNNLYRLCMTDSIPENSLIVVSYFPESLYETKAFPVPYIQINWDEPKFLNRMRELVQPIKSYPILDLPKDRATVALHIRTGYGFDHVPGYFVDGVGGSTRFPMKIPPMKYYINSLKLLVGIINGPVYVHIFTDDPHTAQIVKLFQDHFANSDVIFGTRIAQNNYHSNVLEDFFAMQQFDCLIRSDSNFSLMASRLFPFKIAIAPESSNTTGTEIDRVEVKIRLTETADKPVITHRSL